MECNRLKKYDNMIAIIPARGGSKQIPRKNLIEVAGKPLVAWSIEQAKLSKVIDEVVVSTDDEEISKIAIQYGAYVVKRPKELALDDSKSEDALNHALVCIKRDLNMSPQLVCFLQPTSPIRENNDIENAFYQIEKDKADSLFSGTEVKDFFIWEKKDGNYFSVNYDYNNRKRRQEIKSKYLENGSIYIFKRELLENKNNRLGGKITIYEMPFWKSFQIDKFEDVEICEYYLKNKVGRNYE